MSFSLKRNLGLSVAYRLWAILRAEGYYTEFMRQPLTQIQVNTDQFDHATKWTYGMPATPHGWVAINSTGQVDATTVAVFLNGVQQSPDSYKVDYVNGWVIFPSAPAGALTAAFSRWDVGVRKGFVLDTEVEQVDLPVISWEVKGEEGEAYGIGTSTEFVTYEVNLEMLLADQGTLDDLPSYVRKLIQFMPVYDFHAHQPLGYGNAIDAAFNPTTQFVHNAYFLQRPTLRTVDIRTGQSLKYRYRAVIHTQMKFVL